MKTELFELKQGATWQNIFDTLWHIATVRYVSLDQLKNAFFEQVWAKKCATPKKINILIEKGFLNISENGVLTASHKAVTFLRDYSSYNTDIIKLPLGKGERDTLYNTDVLLQAVKNPDFYALFYPDFYEDSHDQQPFLIPDGALILRKENKGRLIFLEIEREKPNWENYLKEKKWKYEAIAERQSTWSQWWLNWSRLLKLNHCPMDEFGFVVWCIGDFRAEWRGWEFK